MKSPIAPPLGGASGVAKLEPPHELPLRLLHGLKFASLCAPLPLPPPSNAAKRAGLRYQRSLGKGLAKLASKHGFQLTSEPWFSFVDAEGVGHCAPDFLLDFGDQTLVIEAKLTYTPRAIGKLLGLYLPVVAAVKRHLRIRGLVICKSLTPDAPPTIPTLLDALKTSNGISVMLWRTGALPW